MMVVGRILKTELANEQQMNTKSGSSAQQNKKTVTQVVCQSNTPVHMQKLIAANVCLSELLWYAGVGSGIKEQ